MKKTPDWRFFVGEYVIICTLVLLWKLYLANLLCSTVLSSYSRGSEDGKNAAV